MRKDYAIAPANNKLKCWKEWEKTTHIVVVVIIDNYYTTTAV